MKPLRWFDRLEDRVRGFLSHYPIFYGFIAGTGAVLFWRGVWLTADGVAAFVWHDGITRASIDFTSSFWDGPISFALGSIILLACGLFVSEFIGSEIIISGLRGERKLTERTETEVRTETGAVGEIRHDMRIIMRHLEDLEQKANGSAGGKAGEKSQ